MDVKNNIQSNPKNTVNLVVRIPRESYENMKQKAQSAEVSVNTFLNRAGSITTAQQIAGFVPALSNIGAATYTHDETKVNK